MSYGMSCFNCDAQIEGNDAIDVEKQAIDAQWSIGLLADAQAYYACPLCENLLFEPRKLIPILSASKPTPTRSRGSHE